jgi:AraC-like DNA-binding protein
LYRELSPPPDLAPFVECFWVSEVESDGPRRIVPDGCVDVLLFSRGQQLVDAQVVGAMTRYREVPLCACETILGVRFHPGMAGTALPGDISLFNDRSVGLESVLGRAARRLLKDLGRCSSSEALVEKLANRIVRWPKVNDVQQAIGDLARNRGRLSIADLADAAGVGERQLRRNCTRHSGLSPKQLARILRFRHASNRLHEGEQNLARLALDCGYFDQAHMTLDFRDLAGASPARYLRQFGR